MDSDSAVLTPSNCSFVIYLTLLLMLFCSAANSQDKLFTSGEKLIVSLTGPFKTLYRERDHDKVYPGKLRYIDAEGVWTQLEVELQPRGHFRKSRKNCANPPLKIIVGKDESRGSLFEKLKDVKIVVPCNNSRSYEQLVILEYLIYQMYNLLTPQSYRARLMEVSLINTEKDQARTFPGFFIEPHRRLAKRLKKKKVDIKSSRVSELESEGLATMNLFQLMIGNTDFSPISSPGDENCCHNIKLYRSKDNPQLFAIPYDFDFAGFVKAPYAVPSPKLRIKNVKSRLYRGYCEQNDAVRAAVAHFNEKRESIEALIQTRDDLSKRIKSGRLKYVNSFYEMINDPKKLEKKIIGVCR